MTKKQNIISFRTAMLLLVVFFVLLGMFTFYVFRNNRQKQEEKYITVLNNVERQRYANEILSELFFNSELFHQYLRNKNADDQIYFSNKLNHSFKKIEYSLDSIRLQTMEENEEIIVRQLFYNFQKIKNLTLEGISSNQNFDKEKLESYYLSLAKIKKGSNDLNALYQKSKEANLSINLRVGSILENFLLVLFIFSILGGFFIIYYLSRELRNSIKSMDNAVESFMHSKISKIEHNFTVSELSSLSEKLIQANQFFIDVRTFISNLLADNLNQSKFSKSKEPLALELEKLRTKLIENKKILEAQQLDSNQRDWINSGLSKFNEVLRLYSGNLRELSSQLITSLVKYLGAIQGGIFITDEEIQDQLVLYASFAFNRKKYLQKIISFGDGLVGTAVTEKRTIYLTELPSDYLEISSGLGDTMPVALLIVPLVRDEKVYGAFEISSFKKLSSVEIEFVEKVAELTALTINTEQINQKTVRLLGESQRKSDELATQEEEMRQNLEELRATQEESKLKQKKLHRIIDSINERLLSIEFNADKTISNFNQKFVEFTKFSISTMRGRHFSEIILDDFIPDFEQAWQSAINGRQSEFRLSFKSFDFDFLGVFVPIFELETEELQHMLFYFSDVSKFTTQLAEFRKKIEKKDELINQYQELKKQTQLAAEQQNLIANQVFSIWSKHLELAEQKNDSILKLEQKLSIVEKDKKQVERKSSEWQNQLKNIIEKKGNFDDLDSLYKDWLDDL